MLNENAKKWVAALRSGKYKQTKNVLHRTNGQDKFCCLGVACDLFIKSGGKLSAVRKKHDGSIPCISYAGKTGILPATVKKWLGLSGPEGEYGKYEDQSLTMLNDNGKTFKYIAKLIESEPEGLFIDKTK